MVRRTRHLSDWQVLAHWMSVKVEDLVGSEENDVDKSAERDRKCCLAHNSEQTGQTLEREKN